MLRLFSLYCLLSSVALGYDLVRDYTGANFFDDTQGNPLWDFYGSWDNLTLGDVWWLNRTEAFSQRLAYVNEKNQVVMKVDNTANVPLNEKRNSIRIESRHWYGVGSLWVVDIAHVPYGCSVWPAFWTYGEKWPDYGEIDILEAINLQTSNQMALHTLPGCYHSVPQNQLGIDASLDCSTPSGCVVRESTPNSFGTGFNTVGGGVWATQFDVTGIYIWYWARDRIPASVKEARSSSNVDVSGWGAPSASYPATTCDITEFFGPQRLVFDITLCGNWWLGKTKITSLLAAKRDQLANALPTDLLNLAAPILGALQYTDNVVGAGSPKYDQAYFEVNYLRAYTTGSPTPTPTGVGGLRGVGSTALPSQQNAGVSSYFQSPLLPSLGIIASLPLFCGWW